MGGLGSKLETESTGTVATTLTGTSEAESQTDLQDLRSGTPETPEIMGNYPEIADKSPRVKYPEIQEKHPKIQEPESPAEQSTATWDLQKQTGSPKVPANLGIPETPEP